MRMTANRKLILSLLDSELPDCGDYPPYCASSLMYELEHGGTPQSKQQVHRTLRALWAGGFIVGTRIKNNDWNDALPFWEVHYQVSDSVEQWDLKREAKRVLSIVNRHYVGMRFFDSVMKEEKTPEELNQARVDIEAIIDKVVAGDKVLLKQALRLLGTKDDYSILGVKATAKAAQIRKAYKLKAMTAHPDRGGSHDAMIDLGEARDRLIKKAK